MSMIIHTMHSATFFYTRSRTLGLRLDVTCLSSFASRWLRGSYCTSHLLPSWIGLSSYHPLDFDQVVISYIFQAAATVGKIFPGLNQSNPSTDTDKNKIRKLNGRAFAALTKLVNVELRENVCINEYFDDATRIAEMRRIVNEKCGSPEDDLMKVQTETPKLNSKCKPLC